MPTLITTINNTNFKILVLSFFSLVFLLFVISQQCEFFVHFQTLITPSLEPVTMKCWEAWHMVMSLIQSWCPEAGCSGPGRGTSASGPTTLSSKERRVMCFEICSCTTLVPSTKRGLKLDEFLGLNTIKLVFDIFLLVADSTLGNELIGCSHGNKRVSWCVQVPNPHSHV
jgi:hypothetical protein